MLRGKEKKRPIFNACTQYTEVNVQYAVATKKKKTPMTQHATQTISTLKRQTISALKENRSTPNVKKMNVTDR
jgi:hypothetical protein